MVQVYSFVDENGVTRLFAEIHPDPAGTPFNGGTITAPLEIDNAAVSTSLTVNNVGGGSFPIVQVSDSSSRVVFEVDSVGPVQAIGTGANPQAFLAAFANADTSLNPIARFVTENNFVVDIWHYGLKLMNHAAPADGNLDAGDCVLWFDQTDGAAKLMVKAKTANGTVRTGALALT